MCYVTTGAWDGLRARPLLVECAVRINLKHKTGGFVCPKVGMTVLNSVLEAEGHRSKYYHDRRLAQASYL